MFKKVLKSEFSKNVFTLLTGNFIAQLIPLLLTPILSRLFSPEEFGLFAFYISIISFFTVISTGRYELAILLPKKNEEGINVMALCFVILIPLSLLLFLVVFFFENQLLELLRKPGLKGWLYYLPITIFLASTYTIFTYWSNRNKRFKDTSFGAVSLATSKVGVNLYGGLLKFDVFSGTQSFLSFFKSIFHKSYVIPVGLTPIGMGGLVLGTFFGYLLSACYFVARFLKKDSYLMKEISWIGIKKMAKKHDKFPKINSIHALTDQLKNSGVVYVISYMFSDIILGFYSMTLRVLTGPLASVTSSFTQVFLQQAASDYANEQNFIQLIKKTISKLSLIALPIFLPILFFGPQIFSFVLGDKWEVAGLYAQFLTPWLFLRFVVSPVLQIAVVIERQKELFYLSLVGNAIVFGSILIGGYFLEDIKYSFLILSFLNILYYLYCYRYILKLSKLAIDQYQN